MSTSSRLHHSIMTVGDVAKLAGVAPRTVSKWIDSGVLRGWRIPGKPGTGGDRRCLRSEALAFLGRMGVPLPNDAVLLAGVPSAVSALWPKGERVSCLMSLARRASELLPRACVLGFGRAELLHAGPLLRSWLPACLLVALVPDDCSAESWEWKAAGYDASLGAPYSGLLGLLS